MTDKDKSNKLSELCNIVYVAQGGHDGRFLGHAVNFNGTWIPGYWSHNLYSADNFALVWHVLNWRAETRFFDDDAAEGQANLEFNRTLLRSQDLPPEKAQRALLDKIYELALEAGLFD